MLRRILALLFVSVLAACAEPPSKEMNQAQGAIDTARAAGAETFASTEFAAAVDAMRRSEEAVTQRDYRLALSLAIESREHAQDAAKTAGNERARSRGHVEARIAEATTLLAQAREKLNDPAVARLPRRTVQEPRRTIDDAIRSLQDARTAVNNDDYERALNDVQGLSPRIQKAIATLNELAGTPSPRRRR